jgi:hypothetical protein
VENGDAQRLKQKPSSVRYGPVENDAQSVRFVTVEQSVLEQLRERAFEGIVGKWAQGTYGTDGRGTSRLKIKNPHYSQMRARHELFERRPVASRRAASCRPDLVLW